MFKIFPHVFSIKITEVVHNFWYTKFSKSVVCFILRVHLGSDKPSLKCSIPHTASSYHILRPDPDIEATLIIWGLFKLIFAKCLLST